MNKTTFVFVFFIFSFLTFGQNESVIKTDNKQVENLASLAKVWGFLKYYHPAVAKGNFNWDQQLVSIIPKIENARNKEELSRVYLDWIAALGIVEECKSCKATSKKEYFDKNFDLSWTQNANVFTQELSQKLKFIEENRFLGSNYYVTATSHSNIEIRNETEYPDFEYPDRNHRLLSLFRYWNTIEYFFPYKYQIDQNWNAVLTEMIPKFVNAQNATEYHLAMFETVIKLDDTHANFFTNQIGAFFGLKSIPTFYNLIENQIVITGFPNTIEAEWNGLKKGDVIEEMDGKNVLATVTQRKKYIHGSNDNVKARNYDYLVLNSTADSAKLKIRRSGDVFYKTVKLIEGNKFIGKMNANTKKYFIDENNIGYIDLANLEMKDQDKMMQELNNTKALIIDIRNYPSFRPYRISRRLISKNKEYVKIIKPDLNYPGRFIWKKPEQHTPFKNEYYAGKVVLLVNEETQSAAEFLTLLLQSGDNVTTFGSQTAGADGDICKVSFLGFKAFMSGLGVFYPDGTETQRVGVKVDVEVRPTIKGIQEDRDEVLEAAKAYLNNVKI